MSLKKVQEFFRQRQKEDRILILDHSSATVKLAAEALHTEEARIAKTLSFSVKGEPILIVMAGDVKIDNASYRHTFGCKAKMMTPEEAAKEIGHEVGGVCPFAVNPGVTVYLDESLKRFETVFPACGSSNSAIELTLKEMEEDSGYKSWVSVTKPKNDGSESN